MPQKPIKGGGGNNFFQSNLGFRALPSVDSELLFIPINLLVHY